MQLLIESTDDTGTVNGSPCRKWLGRDGNVYFWVLVHRVIPINQVDESKYPKDLMEVPPPIEMASLTAKESPRSFRCG
jgi:hypothetical protein